MKEGSRRSRGNKRAVRGEETRKQRRGEKVGEANQSSHGDCSHMSGAGSVE